MNVKRTAARGQVQVYTGNGKGKTTAAFGLAIRACMAGKKVFIGQFMKSIQYNETRIANFIDRDLCKTLSLEICLYHYFFVPL